MDPLGECVCDGILLIPYPPPPPHIFLSPSPISTFPVTPPPPPLSLLSPPPRCPPTAACA